MQNLGVLKMIHRINGIKGTQNPKGLQNNQPMQTPGNPEGLDLHYSAD